MAPGLLYVTMQPGEKLTLDQFHDWYNNEHGPTRLRLPFIENGFRYRATDLNDSGKGLPEWLAIYDVTDMDEMKREPYLRLRRDDVKSSREKDAMSKIAIDRRLYDLVETTQSDKYVALDDISNAPEQTALLAISQTVNPGHEEEFNKFYREEHVPMLTKVPGWLRTRRFVTSSVEPKEPTEYLALHEFATQDALKTPELQASLNTQWREKIMSNAVASRSRRVYQHYYTFGPAPRDLTPLKDASDFTSPDGFTKVLPAKASGVPASTIESFVTTPDGVDLHYRLEGSTNPEAPLIVLSNSILTHYAIWDGFINEFFSNSANLEKYRVLRYLTRGRFSKCGDKPITVDVLSSDIIALLDALRVKKAAAVIGVSLGGATVLNTALKYPNRVSCFVACDTNSKSPEGNRKAWGDRIAIAQKEGKTAPSGEPIVGSELAEITVRRWMVKESYDGGAMEELAKRVTSMVHDNSRVGFEKSVEALFAYDLRDEMKTSRVRGAFVVGSGDGILPNTMKDMVSQMEVVGAEFHVVDGAGHLPMVEKPKDFTSFAAKFLQG